MLLRGSMVLAPVKNKAELRWSKMTAEDVRKLCGIQVAQPRIAV